MLHSMWDLPGPGIEPMSPALAGRFLTTGPPGKCTFPILAACVELSQTSLGAPLASHRFADEALFVSTVCDPVMGDQRNGEGAMVSAPRVSRGGQRGWVPVPSRCLPGRDAACRPEGCPVRKEQRGWQRGFCGGPRAGVLGPCVLVVAQAAADNLQKDERGCFLIRF